VHQTCCFLDIDAGGFLDVERLSLQQLARFEDFLARAPQSLVSSARVVVEATNRFIAQGGSWEPDERLQVLLRGGARKGGVPASSGSSMKSEGKSLVAGALIRIDGPVPSREHLNTRESAGTEPRDVEATGPGLVDRLGGGAIYISSARLDQWLLSSEYAVR
jgi:hypothetical protein